MQRYCAFIVTRKKALLRGTVGCSAGQRFFSAGRKRGGNFLAWDYFDGGDGISAAKNT
jgi:hypothetical protein